MGFKSQFRMLLLLHVTSTQIKTTSDLYTHNLDQNGAKLSNVHYSLARRAQTVHRNDVNLARRNVGIARSH